jgi:hypothetical protein
MKSSRACTSPPLILSSNSLLCCCVSLGKLDVSNPQMSTLFRAITKQPSGIFPDPRVALCEVRYSVKLWLSKAILGDIFDDLGGDRKLCGGRCERCAARHAQRIFRKARRGGLFLRIYGFDGIYARFFSFLRMMARGAQSLSGDGVGRVFFIAR